MAVAAPAFAGFRPEALQFLVDLADNNTREWFQPRKAEFERLLKTPLEELCVALEGEFRARDIPLHADPAKSPFRIYRDTRFSKDKSPYKTNIGATLSKGGYVSFSAEGLGVGSGMYMPMPDQLDRLRRAIADDKKGGQLVKLVEAVRTKGIEVSAHEELKTAPKGYPKDHPRIDLLRMKGLITWKQWPIASWVGTAKAKQRIIDVLHAAKPINGWLDKNVGPTTMSMERR